MNLVLHVRRKTGLWQHQLAARLGVHERTIRRWELNANKKGLPLYARKALEHVLDNLNQL